MRNIPLRLRILRLIIQRHQIPLTRSLDTNFVLAKPASMHRAIEALLPLIPAQPCLQMRANHRKFVRLAALVLVDRRRPVPLSDGPE